MPASVEELVALLDLEVIEDNLFRGQQPDTHLQRVFGGQVAAHALVAATRTVEEGRQVHSLHSYFLRPGDTQVPIVYDVDPLRDGRSFCTRRVIARQHGRPIFALTAGFQVHEEGMDHQDPMPEVPDPEDCPRLADTIPPERRHSVVWEKEWAALDVRLAGDSRPGGDLVDPASAGRTRLWMRTDGALPDDSLTHTASFTYASDMTLLAAALVPHDRYMGDPTIQSASLDHTIWFHRPFRADEWWLYDQVSPSASGGRGLSLARVFSRDGRLVATVAQEGLIRPIG